MSEQSESFVDRVRDTIAAHEMLTPGERVLVAVSGGPDSVALLHLLSALGYETVVAHLDHMTRDGGSAADAQFVEALANELNIPFVVEREDVESVAKQSADSFEQAARKARYSFFERAAAKHGCASIATGHSADDVAETVLWRMLRGTSVDGIGGIPPVRALGKARVVRPLIACGREAILGYLASHSFAFREDSSNSDPRFLRNRIRHELLPLLRREFNPKVDDALVRLATLARDDMAIVAAAFDPFWSECVADGVGIDRERFSEGTEALQRRVIQRFAHRETGVELTFERTESARQFVLAGRTGAQFDLGGIALVNTRTSTRILGDPSCEEPVPLAIPGGAMAFERRFCRTAA